MSSIIQSIGHIFLQNPIGQTIGMLAFLFGLTAFLHKDDKKFYIIIVMANMLWAVHFYTVGLLIASLASVLNLSRNICALRFKKNKYLIGVFVALYLALGVYLYEGMISLFPIIGGMLATLGVLYFSGISGRIVLLLASLSWVIYAYIGGSLGGILSEGTMIVASSITIFRLFADKNIGQKKYLLSDEG